MLITLRAYKGYLVWIGSAGKQQASTAWCWLANMDGSKPVTLWKSLTVQLQTADKQKILAGFPQQQTTQIVFSQINLISICLFLIFEFLRAPAT